jgi:hypothetical protein
MGKEGEEDTGAAGMDEEMVEVGSMEFTMAAVIAEAEALDPATLEEAKRRMDWPKWDLVIKVELEVLKRWELGELVRGRGGGILLHANGYCTSRRMRPGGLSATRPDLLPKDLLRSTVWIIMKLLHLLPNSHPFEQYSPSLLAIIGPSTCSTSTALSLMGILMKTRKYSWSNHLAMKNLTCRNIVSSCTSHSMDLNKPDANCTRSCATHSPNWDLRSARLTRLFSIFTLARIKISLQFMSMTAP